MQYIYIEDNAARAHETKHKRHTTRTLAPNDRQSESIHTISFRALCVLVIDDGGLDDRAERGEDAVQCVRHGAVDGSEK
jgi:hypothetical protein